MEPRLKTRLIFAIVSHPYAAIHYISTVLVHPRTCELG